MYLVVLLLLFNEGSVSLFELSALIFPFTLSLPVLFVRIHFCFEYLRPSMNREIDLLDNIIWDNSKVKKEISHV
jgi:hypothetical protein